MLIEFAVSNFRSILSRQSCDFVASSDHQYEATHCVPTNYHALPRLTKAAAIFGANASGKSNFLLALRTMRDLALNSTGYSIAQFADCYTPFLFTASAGSPTIFAIDVLVQGVRYRYTFGFNARRIVSEELLVNHSRKSQRWFGRRYDESSQSERWEPFSSKFLGERELWRRATGTRALYLTAAGSLGAEQFKPLLNWFERSLRVMLATDPVDLEALAAQLRDTSFKSRMVDVLHAVDIEIADVRVVGRSADTADAIPRMVELLYDRPGSAPVWLNAQFESSGTCRLVLLLGPLLEAFANGTLIAIDEFDTRLHALVARFLIELMTDPQLTHREAQLLLTSHNSVLMDLNVLRRDEIWLMRLDKLRSSRLSALMDYSPRKHEIVAKGYLLGRFGGVPKIAEGRPSGAGESES